MTAPPIELTTAYKWLEAVAWEYGRNPSEDLLQRQRELTAIVSAAQREDGYLDSVVQLRYGDEGRYQDLPWSHEHYCAGHLIQAAVAQVRCTGDRELLDVAVKVADHLVATFGPGRTEDIDGHPVIEMALVELYRETGTSDYLDLAQWFVAARGHGIIRNHGHEPTYFSDDHASGGRRSPGRCDSRLCRAGTRAAGVRRRAARPDAWANRQVGAMRVWLPRG